MQDFQFCDANWTETKLHLVFIVHSDIRQNMWLKRQTKNKHRYIKLVQQQ